MEVARVDRRGRITYTNALTVRSTTVSRATLLAALLLLPACGTPVGVTRANPRSVHRELTRSVLSSGDLSRSTVNVLFRRDLIERFADQPEAALAELHATAITDQGRRSDFLALAELSFLHAEETDKRSYYLAAAVYAWGFLFPGTADRPPDALDPRARLAADLYNRGLTEGFKRTERGEVEPRAGTFELPFGWLYVDFDPANLTWGDRRLVRFTPVAELEVRGLATRYRWAGIGAPLTAGTTPVDPDKGFDDFMLPWARVVVTALLRIDDPRRQLADGRLQATLTLEHPGGREAVTVGTKKVPLEVESTAALAEMLAESPVWQQELRGFLSGMGVIDEKGRLASLQIPRPGRTPVILVHGTASSGGRWAQMINELVNDARIRQRYQFWLFSYNTGNPIVYSAMLLREALTAAVARLDPDGKDPVLRGMVVIGHSQGGLLTKMTAIESGTRFWDNLSRTPLTELLLSDEERDLLRRSMFVHPLPFVRRTIFIATPQRGSYFAGNWLSHWVARFITLPVDVARLGTGLFLRNQQAVVSGAMGQRLPTAVDNMTPGHPFIKALASIPVVPGVHTHSIIAVTGDGPVEQGTDGVVAYSSAHLPDVESELVVRSGHSCQDNPHTIEEVRRILLLHAAGEP